METAKKGNGFEIVRQYVSDRCRESGVARITSEEIGEAAGMSKQAASKHLKTLIEIGVISCVRRSVYELKIGTSASGEFPCGGFQVDGKLTGSLREVDGKLTKCQPDTTETPPQVDGKLTGSLREVDGKLTKCPKEKEKEKEEEKEKESPGEVFSYGAKIGDGILKSGLPENTDKIDDFIDWDNPNVQAAQRCIETIMPTKSKRWSPVLTKRLVFGVIFCLNGFTKEILVAKSQEAQKQRQNYLMVQSEIERNGNLAWKENPHCPYPYRIVAGHVRVWFSEAGIGWSPAESDFRSKAEKNGQNARKHLRAQQTPTFPALKDVQATDTG